MRKLGEGGCTQLEMPITDCGRKLQIPAHGICELYLTRCAAFGFEQPWIANHNDIRHSARRCDVEPVQAVKKLHPPWRVLRRGGRQRVDDYWRFLTLKLIHRPDPHL